METSELLRILKHLENVYDLMEQKRISIVGDTIENCNLRIGIIEAQEIVLKYKSKLINEVE